MGRKACLFSDTPRGAEASAKLYSLIETAEAHRLEPITCLRYIFERLPQAVTLAKVEALLPWRVAPKPTRKRRRPLPRPSSGNRPTLPEVDVERLRLSRLPDVLERIRPSEATFPHAWSVRPSKYPACIK